MSTKRLATGLFDPVDTILNVQSYFFDEHNDFVQIHRIFPYSLTCYCYLFLDCARRHENKRLKHKCLFENFSVTAAGKSNKMVIQDRY
jgi:hypothetical protein